MFVYMLLMLLSYGDFSDFCQSITHNNMIFYVYKKFKYIIENIANEINTTAEREIHEQEELLFKDCE